MRSRLQSKLNRTLVISFVNIVFIAQAIAAFPDKSLTMEIAFAPGGATDISGRILGVALAKQLGQQVIIENRPGGGGAIAANYVKSAKFFVM